MQQVERKMRGRVYQSIDLCEIEPGDIIMYEGSRCGRVNKVHKGHKLQWCRIDAVSYHGLVVRATKRIELRDIDSAWRKRAKIKAVS